MNNASRKPLPIASNRSLLRDDAEKKLRAAAAKFNQRHSSEDLHEVHRQVLRMIFHDPSRSSEALDLLKSLIPPDPKETSTPPATKMI